MDSEALGVLNSNTKFEYSEKYVFGFSFISFFINFYFADLMFCKRKMVYEEHVLKRGSGINAVLMM